MGEDYHQAGLTPKQLTMLEFAEFLTTTPSGVNETWAEELRSAGWTDEDIIDMVHITALFNYMDRVADGLGVELDADRNWEGLAPKLSFKDDTAPKHFGKIAATPPAQVNAG